MACAAGPSSVRVFLFSGGGSLGARLKSFIDSEEWLRSLGAWTEKKKKEIIESRTLSTRLLVNTFRKLKKPPAHFFVASGVSLRKVLPAAPTFLFCPLAFQDKMRVSDSFSV